MLILQLQRFDPLGMLQYATKDGKSVLFPPTLDLRPFMTIGAQNLDVCLNPPTFITSHACIYMLAQQIRPTFLVCLCIAQRQVDFLYELYAICVHIGRSTHSGHYYAFVKSSEGKWYR